jgi:hypothetical protein
VHPAAHVRTPCGASRARCAGTGESLRLLALRQFISHFALSGIGDGLVVKARQVIKKQKE